MDIRKYIYSHCVSPISIEVHDAVQGCKVLKQVPCGKCLHCRNTKVSEWTTRLYAQSLYSKNVYYITLDYAPFDETNPIAMSLAAETAATHHAINYYKTYGLHPILLRKEHLQRFFKRLRKNTCKSFQYFACGEYGGSYKGHGFGRPHFHIIIFSNDTFSDSDFESAWTLDGYKIGNVDFNDLRANGSFDRNKNKVTNPNSAHFVFKYVCKYLQKNEFDFDNLATIELHKAYFNSLQKTLIEEDTLFPKLVDITDAKTLDENWKTYCKTYAPFVCCSKRPSIGLQYFEENVERFQKQDFRLFGLSDCDTFPAYYIRKTKESLCGFQALGEESESPSSSCRIGSILSSLRFIRDINLSLENWSSDTSVVWCPISGDSVCLFVNGEPRTNYIIKNVSLSFYDSVNRQFYYFNGYGYTLKKKVRKIGFVSLGDVSIDNVITILENDWFDYYSRFLKPMFDSSSLRDVELDTEINKLFPDSVYLNQDKYDLFHNMVYKKYNEELISWKNKGKIISNTKQNF